MARDSLLIMAMLFGSAFCEEWYVQTKTFGSPNFHEVPELNEASTTGLVLGWIAYGIILIVTSIITFRATVQRNTEYENALEEARKKMKELKIDVSAADKEFEELQKGTEKVEETEGLIEVALREGKKLQEAGGKHADNRA